MRDTPVVGPVRVGTGSTGATGGNVSSATPMRTPEGSPEAAPSNPSEADVLLWQPDEDGWD